MLGQPGKAGINDPQPGHEIEGHGSLETNVENPGHVIEGQLSLLTKLDQVSENT